MSEDQSDKTQAPTPYRRAEARRNGQVARSAELSAAMLCLAAVLLLRHGGADLINALSSVLATSLGSTSSAAPSIELLGIGKALAPIAGGLLLVGIAANLVQTGFLFTRRKDTKPLNPFAGLQRIFSARSFVGGMMAAGKLLVVTVVAYVAIRSQLKAVTALQTLAPAQAVAAGLAIVYSIAVRVALALLVIALIDYAYQRFLNERDLRMTRREVKEEMKRQEGNVDMKRRRRGIAAAWAASRLQRDVARADLVLTSAGDSAAVALRFDQRTMSAPRVIARASGALARSIREAAIGKGVPVIERAALATSLSVSVGVGQDVPEQFHADLAEVFAYVREVRASDRSRPQGYEGVEFA